MSRVLIHSLVFSPDSVSTAFIMTDLALELKKLGHSVSVLTTTPHYNVDAAALARQPMRKRAFGLWYESRLTGIPVWHITMPQKGSRLWARALDVVRFHCLSLLLCLRSIGRQDVVIATSPPLTIGAIGWLLAARWRAPAVYKVAELYPDIAIRQGFLRGRLTIRLMHALEQFVYRRNAMMVPIAEQFRRIIAARGVPERKLQTIPDCVDVDVYRPLPRRNAFAEEYGLLDDFVVLYGGNLGLAQDLESILFAAGALGHLPIRFVIVGDGARREWLTREVEARNLKNVLLVEYQPKERMPEITAACNIAVVSLTLAGSKDGFPSKIYSNLACGRPVIVSATPGSEMAAFVAKAGSGRVVPPEDGQAFADAVLAAYSERATLPQEGMRGREFIEHEYSKQAIAKRWDALIRQLAAQ